MIEETDLSDTFFVGMVTCENMLESENIQNGQLSVDAQSQEDAVKNDKWIAPLEINRALVTLKLDTGAKANLISMSDIKKMTDKPKIRKKSILLKDYNGQSIDSLGICKLKVAVKDKVHNLLFSVVAENLESLLGDKAYESLNLVKRVYHINHDNSVSNNASEWELDQEGEVEARDITAVVRARDITAVVRARSDLTNRVLNAVGHWGVLEWVPLDSEEPVEGHDKTQIPPGPPLGVGEINTEPSERLPPQTVPASALHFTSYPLPTSTQMPSYTLFTAALVPTLTHNTALELLLVLIFRSLSMVRWTFWPIFQRSQILLRCKREPIASQLVV
ncbi:hypothetical protein DPX16_23550 [Anabarilius grahami]|uniref:Peptidase A2 domain-containing protein n=1 Tax=Anabarilius grahami TaxID=495550 RepID=A0A3N0Y716_ANAGA|nr:hypothetical protein DPX16_23550 [Anabarilius grahami]